MFSPFSHNFASIASSQGFRLDYSLGTNSTPSMGEISNDATYLAFQKIDISTLICLHVIDTAKRDWQNVVAMDADHCKWAEGLLDRIKNIAIIYVLVGEGPPPWHGTQPEGFKDYYGQSAYSVFWWLDLTNGAVTVSKNQPAQLFGIRGMIEKARYALIIGAEGEAGDDSSNPSAKAKRYEVATLSPIHRLPILTFIIIGINAVILLLIYLAGFPGDIMVPRNLGAIYVDRIPESIMAGLPDAISAWLQNFNFGAIFPHDIFEYGEWYRLFTAMFIHFGAGHFLANVMGLLVFGTRVERYFGRIAFLVIYIFAGLLGSLFSLYLTTAYAAGASGAVYGLIGAIFIYTRLTGRAVELMNWYTLFMFIGVGIAMGFLTEGVDNAGHLGGLVGGLVIGAGMVGILKLRGKG